jgi:hypothetical protein
MLSNSSYIQIELEEATKWQIDTFNSSENSNKAKSNRAIFKKISESLMKQKLRKSLSLQQDSATFYDESSEVVSSKAATSNELKFDLISTLHQFQMQLNLTHVNIFKAILEDMKKNRSMQISKSSSTLAFEDPEPLRITANLNVYYCVDPNMSARNSLANTSDMSTSTSSQSQTNASSMNPNTVRKYFMNQVHVNFVLGYAKLKSSVPNTNFIEFEIPSADSNENSNKSMMTRNGDLDVENEDHDRTLTLATDSNSTSESSSSKLKKRDSYEKYLPLSNTGNINVDVLCYLVNSTASNSKESSAGELPQATSLGNMYELRISDRIVDVAAKARLKSYVHLFLTTREGTSNSSESDANFEGNVKLVMQVVPNGFKFEIPIYLKQMAPEALPKATPGTVANSSSIINSHTQPTQAKPTKNTTTSQVKIFSSRSVIFFGKALHASANPNQNYLDEEFTIKNSNVSETTTCQLTIVNNSSEPERTYFQFVRASDEFQNSYHYDPSMTTMRLVLNAEQQCRIRVRFVNNISNDQRFNM